MITEGQLFAENLPRIRIVSMTLDGWIMEQRLPPNFLDRLAVGGLTASAILATVCLKMMPLPAQNVAVIFPPWTSGQAAIQQATAAGAKIVSVGRAPFIVIVRPTDASYAASARTMGALLVLNASGIVGCVGSAT